MLTTTSKRLQMFRFTPICRPHSSTSSTVVNPYAVLGVTPQTPFRDIRRRFHELTQQYHPDMPNGDPNKFREINAAYRQLRAEYRKQGGKHGSSGADTQSGAGFWAERNRQMYEEYHYQEAQRRAAAQAQEDLDRRTGPGSRHRTFFRQLLFVLDGYEIVLSLATAVVVLVCSVERYYTVTAAVEAKRRHERSIDEGMPPPMPLELNASLASKYNARPPPEELREGDERIREEASYRRATQRRFSDFREFLFVHDPDGIAARKVTTSRFSHQYLSEKDLAKRCPIMREFNSEEKERSYHAIEKELTKTMETTPWASPDAKVAGALVTKGLDCINANSPNTAKWTLIEYVDLDQSQSKSATPTCMAAIRNARFDDIGMVQRISVTGKAALQPSLVAQREKELKSGALKKKQLVRGGVLPIKDLSVPLERMKL